MKSAMRWRKNAKQHFLLTMDYPHQRFILRAGALPTANGKDVFTYGLDNDSPTVEITVGNERLTVLIDTNLLGLETMHEDNRRYYSSSNVRLLLNRCSTGYQGASWQWHARPGRWQNFYNEWLDARVITVNPSVKLYLKQFRGHVFVGLRVDRAPSYVDMFLTTGDNQLHNLHASFQVGERLLTSDVWTDTSPPTNWGNNVDWNANQAKINAEKDSSLTISARVFPYDGWEFQIRRARFAGKQWRMRIEVRDFAGQLPDTVFPELSERKSAARWAILSFAN